MHWYGSKNKCKKDMCLNEIGLRAQNMITSLGSIVNIFGREGGGDLYDHLVSTRIFTLIMDKIFI